MGSLAAPRVNPNARKSLVSDSYEPYAIIISNSTRLRSICSQFGGVGLRATINSAIRVPLAPAHVGDKDHVAEPVHLGEIDVCGHGRSHLVWAYMAD
jgi:hypothetical protein